MTIRRNAGTSSAARRKRSRTPSVSELKLQDDIRLAYERSQSVRLFRNNVGVLQDRNGSYVTYGLCPGSSDLIGFRSEILHCAVCGADYDNRRPVARFAALEIKRPGELPTDTQEAFLRMVRAAGGIAGYADSLELALAIIKP